MSQIREPEAPDDHAKISRDDTPDTPTLYQTPVAAKMATTPPATSPAAHHYHRYPLDKPFEFKTVLILGATSGLGWAMAESFLVSPLTKVIVTGRRKDRLHELVSKFGSERCIAYEVDGTKTGELKEWTERVVKENPELNAVILNSGIQVSAQCNGVQLSISTDSRDISGFWDSKRDIPRNRRDKPTL